MNLKRLLTSALSRVNLWKCIRKPDETRHLTIQSGESFISPCWECQSSRELSIMNRQRIKICVRLMNRHGFGEWIKFEIFRGAIQSCQLGLLWIVTQTHRNSAWVTCESTWCDLGTTRTVCVFNFNDTTSSFNCTTTICVSRLKKPVFSLAKHCPPVPLRLPDDLKTFGPINHNLMTRRWNVNYQNTNRQSWSVFVTTFDLKEKKN